MRRGMGMIELMMVLAILAVATALALPSWGSDASVRTDAAARLLRSDIEYAQVHSIANPDAPIGVVLAPDGTGYWLARSGTPNTPIIRADNQEPYHVTFGEGRASFTAGVSARVDDLTDGMLLFDALGGLSNPAADPSYHLSCDGNEVRMTVRAGTGFIRIHH
ncbi:MAG: type II secretion system protein [Planctomycetota bacterium]|nr:type II secretion system protein [Planctomycetota bacterium]